MKCKTYIFSFTLNEFYSIFGCLLFLKHWAFHLFRMDLTLAKHESHVPVSRMRFFDTFAPVEQNSIPLEIYRGNYWTKSLISIFKFPTCISGLGICWKNEIKEDEIRVAWATNTSTDRQNGIIPCSFIYAIKKKNSMWTSHSEQIYKINSCSSIHAWLCDQFNAVHDWLSSNWSPICLCFDDSDLESLKLTKWRI